MSICFLSVSLIYSVGFCHCFGQTPFCKPFCSCSFPFLSSTCGRDRCYSQAWASRQQWKSPNQSEVSPTLPFQHCFSKKQLQLQCGTRVTQVEENGKGLQGLGMNLYWSSWWKALEPTDGAGNKKRGLGQASHSSGRLRGGWWLPWTCERWVQGRKGCCGRNDSMLWNQYFC